MKIPLAREGYFHILVSLIVLVLFAALRYYAVAFLFLIAALFLVCFFRQPGRRVVYKKGMVLSPADGRIVQIKRVRPGGFFDKEVTRVSIFMSVFNVHVNFAPIEGEITFMEHSQGRYLNALDPKASELNEACAIGFESGGERVLIKQLAGLIARRIKNCVKVSENVNAGDKIGIIMFGSRVDVFIDEGFSLKVELGQKVKAGLTLIGEKT
ncbi:MAG: phosphatidylserine decarboxylase family protein [Candidatus Aureabacteria bacterium]|nr:phosphatidylserine decarboxylase family protein [Candidatus Auribacterota bacterium]